MRGERERAATPEPQQAMRGDAVKEYRIVIFGAGGVGKSSLVKQFLNGKFSNVYVPTVEDSYKHMLQSPDGTCYALEILDTSGIYSFPAMRELNIRSGNAFVLVFALNNATTLSEVLTIRDEILCIKGSENVPIILVGNKSDLTSARVVAPETAARSARECSCRYLETSAKTADNVEHLFVDVVLSYLHPPTNCSMLMHRKETVKHRMTQKRHSDDPGMRLRVNPDQMLLLRKASKKRLSADSCREYETIVPSRNNTELQKHKDKKDKSNKEKYRNGKQSHDKKEKSCSVM